MLTRFSIDPRLGIVVTTVLILAFVGFRLIMHWDGATLWLEPGLFATLFVGGLSGLALALGFLMRPRSDAIAHGDETRPPIIELKAEWEGERPEPRQRRRESD